MADVTDPRDAIIQWMDARGYATGWGDTVEDLLAELDLQAKQRGAATALNASRRRVRFPGKSEHDVGT